MPGSASADTPYEIDPLLDGGIILAGSVLAATLQLAVIDELPGGLACTPPPGQTRCSPHEINPLDRTVIGLNDRGWRHAADGLMVAVTLGTLGTLAAQVFFDDTSTPWHDLLVEATIWWEALAINWVFTYALKFAVQRPRPTHYTEGAPVGSFDHRLSFPSGHASAAATMVTATLTSLFLRHGDGLWSWIGLAAGVALGGVTASGRMLAGRHFPTDVLGGIVIGATSGFVVPWLHRRGPPVQVSPWVTEGGGGVALTWR